MFYFNDGQCIHRYSNVEQYIQKNMGEGRKFIKREKQHRRSNTDEQNRDKELLRYLFTINQQYFQSKAIIDDNCSPRNHKLQIPTNFKRTISHQDFKYSQPIAKSERIGIDLHQLPTQGFFPKNKTERNTISSKFQKTRILKPSNNLKTHNAPCNVFSQYSADFFNMGKIDKLVSVSSGNFCSATNLAFKGISSYKKQFTNKNPITNQQKSQTETTKQNKNSMKRKSNRLTKEQITMNQKIQRNKNLSKQNLPHKKTNGIKMSTEYRKQFQKKLREKQQKGLTFLTTEQIQKIIVS